jgi:hypothetical protein
MLEQILPQADINQVICTVEIKHNLCHLNSGPSQRDKCPGKTEFYSKNFHNQRRPTKREKSESRNTNILSHSTQIKINE